MVITGFIYNIFRSAKAPDTVPVIPIEASDVIPYLQDGDIILRQGDAVWSAAFSDLSLTDKRFSHLGIVRIRENELSIINSVGSILNSRKGVESVSLEKFLGSAMSVGIFRTKNVDGFQISETAISLLGRPFDWDFDLDDDSKIYCTELLYVILKSIAPEINLVTRYFETINKDILPLDSISDSEYFEEIFYIELGK